MKPTWEENTPAMHAYIIGYSQRREYNDSQAMTPLFQMFGGK